MYNEMKKLEPSKSNKLTRLDRSTPEMGTEMVMLLKGGISTAPMI
jgi:hypothetical protein